MKTIQKIWKYLNGNKTIICAFIWVLIANDIINLQPNYMEVLKWVLGAATVGAAGHHISKGYLTSEKG